MNGTETNVELRSRTPGRDSETCRRDSKTYRFGYERETTPPSMAVVAALSEVRDADPTELRPLQTTVEADALDTLVRVPDADRDVHVTLTHENCEITVSSSEVVVIDPRETGAVDDPTGGVSHG